MRIRAFGVLLAATLLAGGCIAWNPGALVPGQSTQADLRRALGEPARTFVAADGSRTLAFTSGPQGTQTYLAQVSPDGRLLELEQVLTEERFRLIEAGRTTSREVERLIGPPWRTVAFGNKRQVAWDYRFQDTWGYLSEFSVMVDERGIVAETISVRQERHSDLPFR